MKLYLMRHGAYELENIHNGNPLSEQGKTDVTRIADFLSRNPIPVSHIFHSEKKRALQTAELISRGFNSTHPLQLHESLNPNDDIEALMDSVLEWDEDILIVGHLPYLSKLASKLIVNDEYKEILSFTTGTLACLERIEQTRFSINWVLAPSLFD